MERIQIHNKSYIVRWISIPERHNLKWSVCPQKQSINIAIIQRPSDLSPEKPAAVDSDQTHSKSQKPTTQNDKTTVREDLQSKGMIMVQWIGKCEAEKVTEGYLNVTEPGTYGVVFDNTFSKQNSKIVMACLIVEPQGSNTLFAGEAGGSQSRIELGSDTAAAMHPISRHVDPSGLNNSSSNELATSSPSSFSGILLKKRRKKNQGYARRLFSLDYDKSTLYYYKNDQSSALRGAIPLALAVVSTDRDSNIIVIDSGVEVWHLKATSSEDYQNWQEALQKALANAESAFTRKSGAKAPAPHPTSHSSGFGNWAELESLISDLADTREAAKKLARNTDPQYLPERSGPGSRKSSRALESNGSDQSSRLTVPSDHSIRNSASRSAVSLNSSAGQNDDSVHDSALAIYDRLDQLVTGLQDLLSTHEPEGSTARSISESEDEFFDAEEGSNLPTGIPSGLFPFTNDLEGDSADPKIDDGDSEEDSDVAGLQEDVIDPGSDMAVTRATDLSPLPFESPVARRTDIPPPKVEPPNIFAMMKKVGATAGSASAPAAANEPLSALQRFSEQFEYTNLLDQASSKSDENGERILYVAAFAISYLSSMRCSVRAKRKPFNPLLGETFELVRDDLGFRMLAEKVSHRPLTLAIHAQSASWTVLHSARPDQKFWGRSAEITTDGPVHVFLHDTGEHYCYTMALTYLKNLVVGTRYVEPVEKMTIHNLTNSQSAVVKFQKPNSFSSNSDNVTVEAFAADKSSLPLTLKGKWEQALRLEGGSIGKGGSQIWKIRDELNDQTPYGFTSFAMSLNEITPIEEGHLAPTDSRLRPDQRLLEEGEHERADEVKNQLEQRQRERREAGEEFTPRWFVEVENVAGQEEGEKLYQLKSGSDGYWEQRKGPEFTNCLPIFELTEGAP